MTDIELLPLPPLYIAPSVEPVDYPNVAQALMDYARANVTHATAAKDAEIEALRAEVRQEQDYAAGAARRVLMAQIAQRRAEARAERLAEALREARDYVATALREERYKFAGHEDCSDIPGIEADLHKIDTALRDHDQEVGNG